MASELEQRLDDLYIDIIGVPGGPLTFEMMKRCAEAAAAIGDRLGYERGLEEAARIADKHNAYEYAISGPRDNNVFRVAYEIRARRNGAR